MLRFFSRIAKISILTVFFILLGLDMLTYYIKNIKFNPNISFDYSSLSNVTYDMKSTIGQERIDIMTRRPVIVSMEVFFPELEKSK